MCSVEDCTVNASKTQATSAFPEVEATYIDTCDAFAQWLSIGEGIVKAFQKQAENLLKTKRAVLLKTKRILMNRSQMRQKHRSSRRARLALASGKSGGDSGDPDQPDPPGPYHSVISSSLNHSQIILYSFHHPRHCPGSWHVPRNTYGTQREGRWAA
jgi:hypothetical protein